MAEPEKRKKQQVPIHWWTARETMPDEVGSTTRAVLHLWLCENAEEWYYQLEKGEDAGRLHYQILFKMKTKTRLTNLLGTRKWTEMRTELKSEPGGYLAPCKTGASEANKRYVSKNDSRVEGPWTSKKIYTGADLACMAQPYPWQQYVLDEVALPADDRHVVWIYDDRGCSGKSKLVKYLGYNGKAKCVSVDSSSRLLSALCTAGPKEAYVIDIPRTLCKDKSVCSVLQVIEALKNGTVQNNMYGKNEEMFFDPPHVFVFSNYPPPREMLSKDRWIVFTITEDKALAAVPMPDPVVQIVDDMPLDN